MKQHRQQQFKAQQSLPEKVFYVPGSWRCCFIFNVEATLRAYQEEWLSVEIRVCPPALLGQVRQALPCLPAAVPWLPRLQAIAESPRGLLGHFSSNQMDYIESLLVTMGKRDTGDPSIILSWLLIWSMWRRRGIALPSLIRILRPASPRSLPNPTRRRRR